VIAMVSGRSSPTAADVALGGALWQETRQSLFLREILRHLAETGATILSDEGRWVATRRIEQLGIPEGVKEVIGRRLTRLSDDVNTALRAGSVLGREFGLDVLEKVTDLGTDALLEPSTKPPPRASSKSHGCDREVELHHALVRERSTTS